MLNCQLCDYYKTVDLESINKKVGLCEYTSFVFMKNIEDYEIEYPCCNAENNNFNVLLMKYQCK